MERMDRVPVVACNWVVLLVALSAVSSVTGRKEGPGSVFLNTVFLQRVDDLEDFLWRQDGKLPKRFRREGRQRRETLRY